MGRRPAHRHLRLLRRRPPAPADRPRLVLLRHAGRPTHRHRAAHVRRPCGRGGTGARPTIWHNWATSEPIKRSLIAHDHCSVRDCGSVSVGPGGPGGFAARIGAGGLGDSLWIWPPWACLALDLSLVRRLRPGPPCWPDEKPVRRWRDPSQMCHPVIPPRPVPASAPSWKETRGRMTMLAEAVDAIIGTGTNRDSHEVEIAGVTC